MFLGKKLIFLSAILCFSSWAQAQDQILDVPVINIEVLKDLNSSSIVNGKAVHSVTEYDKVINKLDYPVLSRNSKGDLVSEVFFSPRCELYSSSIHIKKGSSLVIFLGNPNSDDLGVNEVAGRLAGSVLQLGGSVREDMANKIRLKTYEMKVLNLKTSDVGRLVCEYLPGHTHQEVVQFAFEYYGSPHEDQKLGFSENY